jgi:hypothetical protein
LYRYIEEGKEAPYEFRLSSDPFFDVTLTPTLSPVGLSPAVRAVDDT